MRKIQRNKPEESEKKRLIRLFFGLLCFISIFFWFFLIIPLNSELAAQKEQIELLSKTLKEVTTDFTRKINELSMKDLEMEDNKI